MHLSTPSDVQAVMPLIMPLITQFLAEVSKLPPDERARRILPASWRLCAANEDRSLPRGTARFGVLKPLRRPHPTNDCKLQQRGRN